MTQRADWYKEEHDSTWDRVKHAFQNDWEQTKNDFGSDTARDMDQDVDDTIKQAVDADNKFENREQAFRFGHAAQSEFDNKDWNAVEPRLRQDYHGDFDRDRDHIRHAYQYDY